MKITKIRKNSKGLVGTYENINHHAKEAEYVVKGMVKTINEYGDAIKEWKQGHNVHIIESWDGRKLAFTPHKEKDNEINGVQISLYVSRGKRIPLFRVNEQHLGTFHAFLHHFLLLPVNTYGAKYVDEN